MSTDKNERGWLILYAVVAVLFGVLGVMKLTGFDNSTKTTPMPAPVSECERNWQNRDPLNSEWDHDTFIKNCEKAVDYLNK